MLALVRLSMSSLPAQITATATLEGTVTDATGAVIPNANVKINNKSTGELRTAISNGAGLYSFNLLPAGIYEVRVSVAGFSTAAFENVEVAVSHTTTIDAQLSPSQQATTVMVEALGASLVDVEKSDVSRSVSPVEVENFPSTRAISSASLFSRRGRGRSALTIPPRHATASSPPMDRAGAMST